MNIYGYFYRLIMKVAHAYNWHYAPPIYPNGNTQLWCKWCGFRQTIKFRRRGEENLVVEYERVDPQKLLDALRGDGKTCYCGRPLLPVFDKLGKRIGVTHTPEDEDYCFGLLTELRVEIPDDRQPAGE